MTHFIEGLDRQQTMLLPEHLDDYVDENSHVRAIDAFADVLDLAALGFNAQAAATGRPGYHPGLMLRIYIYGYLNQVQSSRRLERECGRNLELIWLTGRLKPDFKTIADFRKDIGQVTAPIVPSKTNARPVESGVCVAGNTKMSLTVFGNGWTQTQPNWPSVA